MIYTKERMRRCITLLILNLAFIWGNSLLPGGISGALSNGVSNVLAWFFPRLAGVAGQQGSGLLRKLTHFGEFALLGMCLRWLFGMLKTKPLQYLLPPWLLGVAAAFIDEGIQMFVPDRGPGLKDVAIDASGVTFGIVLLTILHLKTIKRRKNHEKASAGETMTTGRRPICSEIF